MSRVRSQRRFYYIKLNRNITVKLKRLGGNLRMTGMRKSIRGSIGTEVMDVSAKIMVFARTDLVSVAQYSLIVVNSFWRMSSFCDT